jgi:hypothetical protein
MIIKHEDLIAFLESHYSWGTDSSPREAFGIDFQTDRQKARDVITYHTAAGGALVLSVDESGKVLSIEIV